MKEFSRIGVDLAKGFFQVHALEREGAPAVTRKLSRAKFPAFFAGVAPSRIGMEACGSAHYWARELRAMGREVALIAPIYVKPYLKRGKNDANDAAAVCEAMSRPDMRFVPVKSADQQAALMLHKTRDLLVKQRTMTYERAARPPLGVRPDPPPRASTRSRTCWRLRRRTTACRRPRARRPGYWPPTSRGLRRASTRSRRRSPPRARAIPQAAFSTRSRPSAR